MPAQDFAIGRDEFAGCLGRLLVLLLKVRGEEPLVIAAGNEADFLGVGLFGQAQPRSAPPTSAPAHAPAPADSLTRRYISPSAALWRSLLLPGWGQARLNRKLTAGLFIAWEGVTLGMSLKTLHELEYLRRTNSGRADDKRQEHEDWVVLLGFNHVLAGLEAYISAHLADFPGDLHLEAVPGGAGAAVSVPLRLP